MNGTTHPLVGYGELSRPSASLARRFQMRCLLIRICLIIIQYFIRYETSLVRSTIIRECLPHVGKFPACALKSRNDSDCHARSAPPTRLLFLLCSQICCALLQQILASTPSIYCNELPCRRFTSHHSCPSWLRWFQLYLLPIHPTASVVLGSLLWASSEAGVFNLIQNTRNDRWTNPYCRKRMTYTWRHSTLQRQISLRI
jgi:hypothetical protein